ncbi:MAG: hypothetical protein J1F03_09110 [Oscillospiraceae bacterium]|nr:hypothetical protein [Oscillospiraceae bacterium]
MIIFTQDGMNLINAISLSVKEGQIEAITSDGTIFSRVASYPDRRVAKAALENAFKAFEGGAKAFRFPEYKGQSNQN